MTRLLAATVAIGLCGMAIHTSASAADDKHGLTCISVDQIDQTPVIDDRTILIQMRAHGHYKRIDLAQPCPDLQFHGFVHSTPENHLCSSDPLRVIGPGGAVCMIDRIVDIPADEAKALLSRKK